jgi:hypothetical protein
MIGDIVRVRYVTSLTENGKVCDALLLALALYSVRESCD